MKVIFGTYNYNKNVYNKPFRGINASRAFSLTKDSFEKTAKDISKNVRKIRMEIYNPYSEGFCASEVTIDYTKPQIIRLQHSGKKPSDDLVLKYDPESIGTVYDRHNGNPIKTAILRAHDPAYENEDTFIFMSQDLMKEYGYVSLSCHKAPAETIDAFLCPELVLDYPEQGIVGGRITVDYLLNSDEKNIKGIGKLADKIELEYSKENNLNPNIISYAGPNSQATHFLRGKRFLPLEKNSADYLFFLEKYGCIDPNNIIEHMLKYSNGKHVNIDVWKILPIYMPSEMIKKLNAEPKIKLPSFAEDVNI